MKDTKSLLLIIISFLLLAVSMVLLWTWGYKIGTKNGSEESKIVVLNDSSQISSSVKDSLFNVYVEAMNNLSDLDAALSKADSLKSDINNKIGEFYQIRNELLAMLNKPVTKTVINDADAKLGDLKKRMDQLKVQNSNIEKENKRLAALLSRLPSEMKPPAYQNADTANAVVDTPARDLNNNLTVNQSAADIAITCFTEKDGERLESDSAAVVEKIAGSFTFNTPADLQKAGWLYVVIICPDGKVLKSSGWDTGAFESKEGRKIYSCSIKYDLLPGELQSLSFAVPYDNFQKGDYQVQIFQDGTQILNTTKTLY